MQGSPVQFDFEDISPVEKRLKVEVAREHVNHKLDEAYRKLARDVNLRGFRKGKAPRPLLERMFGKRVEAEVVQDLLQESFMRLSTDSQMRLASQPTIDEMPEIRRDQALRFSARLEMIPKIVPDGYDGVALTRRAVKITDEDVNRTLMRRRNDFVEMEPIEGRDVTAATDVVEILMSGRVGKHDYENQKLSVDLSDPAAAPLPGLAEALVGLPIATTDREIKLTLPATGLPDDMAGQELTLKVTIQSAHLKRLPELDDEFAKDTGEAETLDELRGKIRDGLVKADEQEIEHELRDQLMDELLKKNPVPLPPSMVQRFTKMFSEQEQREAIMEAMASGRGAGSIDREAIEQAMHTRAVHRLSLEFLLTAIADKEQIEVTDADMEMRLAEMARQSDKSVSRIKAEVQKSDPQLQNMRTGLRLEKTLDLLLSRAKIGEAAE